MRRRRRRTRSSRRSRRPRRPSRNRYAASREEEFERFMEQERAYEEWEREQWLEEQKRYEPWWDETMDKVVAQMKRMGFREVDRRENDIRSSPMDYSMNYGRYSAYFSDGDHKIKYSIFVNDADESGERIDFLSGPLRGESFSTRDGFRSSDQMLDELKRMTRTSRRARRRARRRRRRR